VRLFTRNGFDWIERYPRISGAVATLGMASVTIDGEAVWCDGQGLAIFDKLHSRAYEPR
jgi:ATP-dependent DNA ligase